MISSALRSGALEIFIRPSSGEFISSTRKIAAAIEQALTMSARNTIQLRGAKRPKLRNSSVSQKISTPSRIGGSPRCASSITVQRARDVVRDLARLRQQRALLVGHRFELAQHDADGVDAIPALEGLHGRTARP